MTNNIGSILKKRHLEEPPEFQIIRRFVIDKIDMVPKLETKHNKIFILIPNAAAAGTLQLALPELSSKITGKKLMVRIG